ncbi:hypothetical protein MKW94_025294, partial [Papaver nudicaule]|nr:hypothetical protein [Papaver nudicaule]
MDVTFLPKLLPVASYTPGLSPGAICSPKMPKIAKTYILSAVTAAPMMQPFRNTILEKMHAVKKKLLSQGIRKFCGILPSSSATLLTNFSADAVQGLNSRSSFIAFPFHL